MSSTGWQMYDVERCPCCGAVDRGMVWLRASGGDHSRLVCDECRESALEGDPQVWSFYWNATQTYDDDPTWRDEDLYESAQSPAPPPLREDQSETHSEPWIELGGAGLGTSPRTLDVSEGGTDLPASVVDQFDTVEIGRAHV